MYLTILILKLPKDIEGNILKFLDIPETNLYGNDISGPLDVYSRLNKHKMVNNILTNNRKLICGCLFYEEHRIKCYHHILEKLEEYDPHVKQTYLNQAVARYHVNIDIKNQCDRRRVGIVSYS